MPMITISFNYPDAPLPKYKFGDRVALSDECAPCNWLTGKIVGLTLDENYQPCWYYSLKLDVPSGLTEEYQGDDLVLESEIHSLQLEWEKDNCNYALAPEPSPKFELGMLVRFSKNSGCNMLGGYAQVISRRYVRGEDWSGWVYQLTNDHLSEVIEIGESLLEPISSTTKTEGNQRLAEIERG